MVLYEIGILAIAAWSLVIFIAFANGFAFQKSFVAGLDVPFAFKVFLLGIKGAASAMKQLSTGFELGLSLVLVRIKPATAADSSTNAAMSEAVRGVLESVPRRRGKMTPA